ncbi:MAG: ATP-binding protein, partial [Bacteroidota bacterium]
IQFRNNRQKNEANKILNKQKIEIESQKTQIESSLERLKITQKQLIQQEKLASLGELTAGIAHEIQNPLNFVNNFSEVNIELIKEIQDERTKTLTERDEALEKELLSDLLNNQDKIYHHGKRASGIVKAMLDHSRNSTGQRTKIEINPLVEEYLKLSFLGLRAKYPNFSADYQLDVDPNVPLIEVVSQDIGRVLLNLMNNAFYAVMDRKIEMDKANIEYSPKVIVNTKFNPNEDLNGHLGYVEIRVEDNGNGVNEAIKDKILQPFFTTKPTGEGTGLGLSLSYEIITKGHNGTLAIESTEGEGATFVIKLPIQ